LPGFLVESPRTLVAEGLAVVLYVLQDGVVMALGFLFLPLLPGRAPGVDPTPDFLCGAVPLLPDLPLRANLVKPLANRFRLRSEHAIRRE